MTNRVHLDLAVSGPGTSEDSWHRIVADAARRHHSGARVLTEFTGRWITRADPVGNQRDGC